MLGQYVLKKKVQVQILSYQQPGRQQICAAKLSFQRNRDKMHMLDFDRTSMFQELSS